MCKATKERFLSESLISLDLLGLRIVGFQFGLSRVSLDHLPDGLDETLADENPPVARESVGDGSADGDGNEDREVVFGGPSRIVDDDGLESIRKPPDAAQ